MKKVCIVLLLLVLGLSVFCLFELQKQADGKLHVVFCDVGQGDGIYIKTPSGADVLMDGGPDDSIVGCMERHMPLWDRDIELMMLSHPHLDHFGGLMEVLNRYTTKQYVAEKMGNKSASYNAFVDLLSTQHIPEHIEFSGDKVNLGGVDIKILGPSNELLQQSSSTGLITGASEQVTLVLQLSYGTFDVLFTGDSQTNGMADAIGRIHNATIEVLKVPHHGSKTGLNDDILSALRPKIAVISVGKKNKYGHPAPAILKLLKDHNIKTLRTDESGDIEIVSDGKSWYVK